MGLVIQAIPYKCAIYKYVFFVQNLKILQTFSSMNIKGIQPNNFIHAKFDQACILSQQMFMRNDFEK